MKEVSLFGSMVGPLLRENPCLRAYYLHRNRDHPLQAVGDSSLLRMRARVSTRSLNKLIKRYLRHGTDD